MIPHENAQLPDKNEQQHSIVNTRNKQQITVLTTEAQRFPINKQTEPLSTLLPNFPASHQHCY